MITCTAPTRPSRRSWTAVALAAPVAALLAGCSSGEEPAAAPSTSAPASASAAGSSAAASTSTSTPTPAPTTATGPADAPTCPDAAVLAAVAPSQAPGVQLTDPTCSGSWAVIGTAGPTIGPSVQVFRYVDGAWQPADRGAVCAAGELPADLEPCVCQAG